MSARLIVFVLLLAMGRTAWAQQSQRIVSEKYQDVCAVSKECGQAVSDAASLSAAGKLDEALVRYESIYARWPAAWLQYNIARIEHRLSRWAAASQHYEHFLASTLEEDLEVRAQAEQYLAEVKQQLALSQQLTKPGPSAPAAKEKPLHRKWWLWSAVGVGLSAVVVTAASVAARPAEVPGDVKRYTLFTN